jgi:hypothetical protein
VIIVLISLVCQSCLGATATVGPATESSDGVFEHVGCFVAAFGSATISCDGVDECIFIFRILNCDNHHM